MKIIEDKIQSALRPTSSWPKVRQGDIARFYNGRAYKLSEWENSGIPVVRLQNLTGTGNKYYYSNLKLPEHQYCYPGDLLYMWSATLGPFLWNEGKAIYHYHIWKVVVDSSRVDKMFFFYLLDENTNKLMRQSHGSTMLHVTKSEMENQLISLPCLLEQQKIAETLNCVDEKIELIKSQIAQTNLLKKGLMQQLLTKGIGHTKFKSSPLGEIPESWAAMRLGALLDKVGSGITPKGGRDVYQKEGVIFIRSQNVLSGKLDLSDVAYISVEQNEKMKNSQLQTNDVLLNITGASIGRSCLFSLTSEAANVNQHVCILRCNEKLAPKFLAQFLNSTIGQGQVEKFQAGGNREGLNYQQIKSFYIGLPPLKEQERIAEILESVDRKIEVLNEKKSVTSTLKKGLMQQLLSGKIRVKIDEEVPIS